MKVFNVQAVIGREPNGKFVRALLVTYLDEDKHRLRQQVWLIETIGL